MRLAIENNFQIKVADKGRDIGQRNWIVEKAVFDPYFSASSDYSKNRAPTSSFLDIGVGGLRGLPLTIAQRHQHTRSSGDDVHARLLRPLESLVTLCSWLEPHVLDPEARGLVHDVP